jgi:large subunit ribosomal protein L22
MEAKAIAKNIGVTPRKARLVCDTVRGLKVSQALAILSNLNKAASLPVAKAVKSAAANATHNLSLNESDLYIKAIFADESIKMRRFLPRGKGNASKLIKRFSHITVIVDDGKEAK